MRKLLSSLWLLALLGAASAQTLGPGASGPCSAFGTAAGTCAQGNAAVPYTGAASAINLNGQQLNNVIIGTTTPLAGAFTTVVASGLLSANGSLTAGTSAYTPSIGLAATVIKGKGDAGAGNLSQVILADEASATSRNFGFINALDGDGIFSLYGGTAQAGSPFVTEYLQMTGTRVNVPQSLVAQGDFVTITGSPSIASGACGTGTNGTIAGDNLSGIITIGAIATTSCAITFSKSLQFTPNACIAFPANAAAAASTVLARIGTIGTAGFTLSGAVLASTAFNYHCY